MRISKYIHSCLLIEKGGDRILFDPGKFSFVEGLVKPEQFEGLTAVVLTHQHPDHVDHESLKKILEKNPSALVITNSEIRSRLDAEGVSAELLEEGARAVGGFRLRALAAEHAKLLDSEAPQNTAYVVDDALLHPGDSFDRSLDEFKGIPALALPLMAPWTTELSVGEFARRIAPRRVIPIHDGYAKEFFLKQRYENFQKYFSKHGIEFLRMEKPGDAVEIEA
jgi:L-ascorbate metabolism protein UlaG (beta-lactamase superfamily)